VDAIQFSFIGGRLIYLWWARGGGKGGAGGTQEKVGDFIEEGGEEGERSLGF